jgi:dTDP-4-dehydrorhamnose 3,5-epimerase|tara:strand:+ start:705 stop:1145 length:441 start_codon:yes stop_codon:yes gene_type:complete
LDKLKIKEIKYTSLKKISNPLGDVWHALKSTDNEFIDFGEAYFSYINKGKIKGWKKHKKATLNLIVPIGEIKFFICNEKNIDVNSKLLSFTLSEENYFRLTISPGAWFAFKGLKEKNMLLNISDYPHDPLETVTIEPEEFPINLND